MKYVKTFTNDPKMIALGVILIFIVLTILVFAILRLKVERFKKIPLKRLNGICVLIGAIIGLSVSGSNGFRVFDEFDPEEFGWIQNGIWLVASFTNMCVSIMFTGYLLTIPFKILTNFYQFTIFKHPQKKFMKLTGFYAVFGLIAIAVSLLMYPLAPTFMQYTSDFSFHPTPLNVDDNHLFLNQETGVISEFPIKPTLFIVANYMLIKVFKIKTLQFTVIFAIYLGVIILFAISFIFLFIKLKPEKLPKVMNVVTKISDKSTEYLTMVTPVFAFSAMTVSLMVQPAGTALKLCLVIILMLILFIAIYLVDFVWALSTGSIRTKNFVKYSFKAFRYISKNPLKQDVVKTLTDDRSFRGFKDFNAEQNIYNIFVSGIFPIIVVAYLGFSAGPLYCNQYFALENGMYVLKHFEFWQHIVFWITLYFYGYILTFAYAFRYNDTGPYRMVLSGAVPWIRNGFNMGILIYFNAYINKLAVLSTYTTYLAIACKHDFHYKKLIK